MDGSGGGGGGTKTTKRKHMTDLVSINNMGSNEQNCITFFLFDFLKLFLLFRKRDEKILKRLFYLHFIFLSEFCRSSLNLFTKIHKQFVYVHCFV